MSLPHELRALKRRLERSGAVVVERDGYLELRLALFCRVQVRLDGDRLRCEAFFGRTSRSAHTYMTTAAVGIATIGAFLAFGVSPISLAAGFLVLSSRAYDAYRFILTESCITRVQLIRDAMVSTEEVVALPRERMEEMRVEETESVRRG